jgi:hypothetical protein
MEDAKTLRKFGKAADPRHRTPLVVSANMARQATTGTAESRSRTACSASGDEDVIGDGEAPSRRVRGVASWSECTEAIKLAYIVRAIVDQGGHLARTFTLDLNPEQQQRALTDPKSVAKDIRHKVGLSTWLLVAFGADDDGRIHCHGAFAATSQADLKRVRDALRVAGGKWGAERGARFQVDVDFITNEQGWARYLLKNVTTARIVAQSQYRMWSVTSPARRAAESLYRTERARANAATGIPARSGRPSHRYTVQVDLLAGVNLGARPPRHTARNKKAGPPHIKQLAMSFST